MFRIQRQYFLIVCLVALPAVAFVGCKKPDPPRFHLNLVSAADKDVLDDTKIVQQKDVANILAALLGTPNEPYLDKELAADFDFTKIRRAAGPVASDINGRKVGLFREHCVHCHGISGDGQGSLARFLNPYPRDYRQGIFKFKSTDGKSLPSHSDLMAVLENGINGTSMPSFRLLPKADREALVEYVKYLTLRGRAETAVYELIEPENQIKTDRETLVAGILVPLAKEWTEANTTVVDVPAPPANIALWNRKDGEPIDEKKYAEFRESGRKLFYDINKGVCIKCHGSTGMGDGVADNRDDWNKKLVEVLAKIGDKGYEAKNKSKQIAWIKETSLPERFNNPRNLRLGMYRGGNRPVDIFNKIHAGINGSGMPGNTILTPEEKWQIVAFVLHLPYEPGGSLLFPADTKMAAPDQRSH